MANVIQTAESMEHAQLRFVHLVVAIILAGVWMALMGWKRMEGAPTTTHHD